MEQDERDNVHGDEETSQEAAQEAQAEPQAEAGAEPQSESPAEPQAEGTPAEPEAPAETEAAEEAAPGDVSPEPEAGEAAPDPEAVEVTPTDEPGPEAPSAAPQTLTELAAGARYTATGKRKSSVARVILTPGTGQFRLNGRPLEVYFPRRTHQVVVQQPLETAGFVGSVDVIARIHGGGISGQADALRHGIAKALIGADPALRGELKRRQLLTRDPRVKERRKAGLKKARKRPQFSKR
jgi:small subunit ribosomal protein S9